jgi:hypothetical protein
MMVGGAIVVVAVALFIRTFGGSSQQTPSPSGAVDPPRGVRSFVIADAGHTDRPVEYDVTPPVGGQHAAAPQTCGFYTGAVRSENAVHSLEHGAVWITYRPSIGRSQLEILRRLAEGHAKVLVSAWPSGLPAPVVASAWGRQLRVRSASDGRLAQFIAAFEGGGNAPEPVAACQGVGETGEVSAAPTSSLADV